MAESTTPGDGTFQQVEKDLECDFIPDRLLTDNQKNMTREEFCEVVVNLYQYLKQKSTGDQDPIADPAANPFTDTNNPVVLQAYSVGIVQGAGNGRFYPQDKLTIQEKAVMLYNTLKIFDPSIEIENQTDLNLADEDEISSWATKAVTVLNDKNILKADKNNEINPTDNITREDSNKITSSLAQSANLKPYHLYGYNVLEYFYVNHGGVGSYNILDPDLVNDAVKNKKISIDTFDYNGTQIKDYVSTSASQLYKKLNVKADAKYKGVMFSGYLHDEYGEQEDLKSNSTLIKHMEFHPVSDVAINFKSEPIKPFLSQAFLNDVKKLADDSTTSDDIDKIFELYGTHLFKHYYLGGRLDLNFNFNNNSSTKLTENQITAGVSGTYGSADIDAKTKELADKITSNSRLWFTAAGGSGITGSNIKELTSKYDSWLASLEGNEDLCGIPDNYRDSLMPIWELLDQNNADDKIIAAKLKAEYDSLSNGRQIELDNYVPEVIPPKPPAPAQVVTDIIVVAAKDKDVAIKAININGYTPVKLLGASNNDDPIDFNKGARGDYVYMAYKLGSLTDKYSNDIRDILISEGKNDTKYFHRIPVDLNQGAGGEYIYLNFGNVNGGKHFSEMRAVVSDNKNYSVPAGWETPLHNIDLNKGARGKFIYLLLKRASN
jgi:hypothetical protein